MRRLGLAVVMLCAALLPGCASVWEKCYAPETWVGPAAAAPATSPEQVQLRFVPWERVQATLQELNDEAAASGVSPEEWPAEKRAEVKGRLLRGLQVSEEPERVDVLGRSAFRSTSLWRLETGDAEELKRMAAGLGANRVIWSRSVLGKTETIVNEPVWTRTTADYTTRQGRRGYRTQTYTEHTTTWVPVAVQADEYGYVAFFLRDR